MQRKLANIYEINTRLWLKSLSEKYDTSMQLADIPDTEIATLREMGFDALWLMGIWTGSPYGRRLFLNDKKMMGKAKGVYPDIEPGDITSSPYAVSAYDIDPSFGGRKSVLKLRDKLQSHRLKLILDFVPNHLAVDHPWVREHPDYFILGSTDDLRDYPEVFFPDISTGIVYAHAKDPFSPAWIDVAQLNYFNPELRRTMKEVLVDISSLCDGVVCDRAMLITSDFQKNIWGERVFAGGRFTRHHREFWQEALDEVHRIQPSFMFIGGVYWGFEEQFIDFGFDYTYDKPFYDALRDSDIKSLKISLRPDEKNCNKRLRYIENHDEGRALSVFGPERSKAAALIACLAPGACLFHQGQLEGLREKQLLEVRKKPHEKNDPCIMEFYKALLALIKSIKAESAWELTETRLISIDDPTYKAVIALYCRRKNTSYLAVVNYYEMRSRCCVPVELGYIESDDVLLKDLFENRIYIRDKKEITSRGLYVDLPPYAFHLFQIETLSSRRRVHALKEPAGVNR